MKTTTLAIAVAALAVSSFSSCKKDDDNNNGLSGRSAQIVGSWKQTEQGSDINANGVWDNSEKTPVAAADAATFVFNSNGTGSGTQNFLGLPIAATTKWTLLNNDNDIRIIGTVAALNTTDTFFYNIVSLTGTEVIIRDTADRPISYQAFTKQ